MYAARGLYVFLNVCSWMYLCIYVPGMCPWNVSLYVSLYVSLDACPWIYLCIYVPGICPWNMCLVCVSLNVFLWFACTVFSSLCLVSTLKNDQSKCNEAYQTPVTSNIRWSGWVTRKVSSVLLDYILKVEQGLGLLDGDSRTCRSRYVSKVR